MSYDLLARHARMVCNVWFKNKDQAICPAECVNAVNRDERAFVKHGRMQDLLRGGGATFYGLGKLRAGEAARGVTTCLLRRFWGMPPPQKKKIYIYF